MNAAVYRCFSYIDESEARKFIRKFRDQPHDKVQVMHTFRELILGAFLAMNGLQVPIFTTPRLSPNTKLVHILDESARPQCVVELLNFNPSAATSQDVVDQLQAKGIWCNWVAPNTERLYSALWEKATRYSALAERRGLSYVIGVFGDFIACVEPDELDECLLTAETGLFWLYPAGSLTSSSLRNPGGPTTSASSPNPHAQTDGYCHRRLDLSRLATRAGRAYTPIFIGPRAHEAHR